MLYPYHHNGMHTLHTYHTLPIHMKWYHGVLSPILAQLQTDWSDIIWGISHISFITSFLMCCHTISFQIDHIPCALLFLFLLLLFNMPLTVQQFMFYRMKGPKCCLVGYRSVLLTCGCFIVLEVNFLPWKVISVHNVFLSSEQLLIVHLFAIISTK